MSQNTVIENNTIYSLNQAFRLINELTYNRHKHNVYMGTLPVIVKRPHDRKANRKNSGQD